MSKTGVAAVLLALATFANPPGGHAADLAKADGLYDKGLFQEALKEYEGGLKSPDQETRLKSLYRAVECQGLLFRYGEAAQRAFDAKLPADPLWRGRFLIMRAELAQEFLKQYGYAAPQDVEEGQKDMTRRTPDEWRAVVRAAYRELWGLRRKLIEAPLKNESYFVDLRNAELELAPTLWDLAVLRWSEYLVGEEQDKPGMKPAASSLLGQEYTVALSFDAPRGAQAAALYEDAAGLGGADRKAVRELWRIKRVSLAFDAPGLFERASDYKAFAQAAVAQLAGWMGSFATPLGRSEAGFAAANLLNGQALYEETVKLCRQVEKDFARTRAAKHCAKLRATIELPVMNLTAKFVPPAATDALHVNTRNLDKVYFRLYRVTPDELLSLPRPYQQEGWSVLRNPDKQTILSYLAQTATYTWATNVHPKKPYEQTDTAATSPELAAGIYLALASSDERFAPGSSLFSAVFINASDLFMIASSGAQGPERDFIFEPGGPRTRRVPALHFYTLNGLTGKPVAARIDAFRHIRWQNPPERVSLDTDDSGRAQDEEDATVVFNEPSNVSFDPLAKRGASYAYPSNPLNFNNSVPAPISLFVETDRPIYRPGQEVRVKVSVLRRIPRGYKVYDGTSVVSLRASDANGQELYKAELKLNAMGTASARFTIAGGRMLGYYSLNASLNDFGYGFSGYQSFQVEEYKRPEFEVEVKEAEGAWRFGQNATVTGQAKYYFGGAVPDAPVHYRIRRESYFPWFCWWWRGIVPNYGQHEVASDDVKTDSEGKFSFTFTPQPYDVSAKDPMPESFIVDVESRDPGGRTITASRTFRAGAKAYLFDIAPDSGFLSASKPSEIPIRLMSLNEKALSGAGTFSLHRLIGLPKVPDADGYWSGSFLESPSLETLYKGVFVFLCG